MTHTFPTRHVPHRHVISADQSRSYFLLLHYVQIVAAVVCISLFWAETAAGEDSWEDQWRGGCEGKKGKREKEVDGWGGKKKEKRSGREKR